MLKARLSNSMRYKEKLTTNTQLTNLISKIYLQASKCELLYHLSPFICHTFYPCLYFDWCHWKLLRQAMLLAVLLPCATPRRALPPSAALCVVAMMDRLSQLYRCHWKWRGKLTVQVATEDGNRNREKGEGDWHTGSQEKSEQTHQSFLFWLSLGFHKYH